MSTRIILQPAYVLHKRPFRDSSFLVDLFTLNYGRFNAIARGVRRNARTHTAGILMPFTPLLISWSGKTELVTLNQIESSNPGYNLQGKTLLSGLYLNELLVKLLHTHDAHVDLFHAYEEALAGLQNNCDNYAQQLVLRRFEKKLLRNLGYELRFDCDITGMPIEAQAMYLFEFGVGLKKMDVVQSCENVFKGENLWALHVENLRSPEDFSVAKHLLRLSLQRVLDHRPIKTRELFN